MKTSDEIPLTSINLINAEPRKGQSLNTYMLNRCGQRLKLSVWYVDISTDGDVSLMCSKCESVRSYLAI